MDCNRPWIRSFPTLVVAALLLAACSDGRSSDPTPSAETTTVEVFFVDEEAFATGELPYVTPVEREVDSSEPSRAALEALFAGPTPEEASAGLVFVASEADGFDDLRIDAGVAHVRLTGGCSSGGSTMTIAQEIVPTLSQFPEVEAVRIYDPEGETEAPNAVGDSIPECLEP